MEAITNCLLLLASACLWHIGDAATESGLIPHHFGVIGGTPADITEAPFMAIFRGDQVKWWCGASIVHQQFLVSAGHCVSFKYNMTVTVGTDKIDGGETYEIEKIFRHPKFDGDTGDYDTSVIKLTKKLKFNKRVALVTMADSTLVPKPGDTLRTLGFGDTTGQNTQSEQLLKIDIPNVDRETCQKNFDRKVTERMICAGGVGGKSSCHGDSGGPLIYKNQLIGVVSWGERHCNGLPGVYSYVPSMRDFIDETIKNNS